MTTKHTPLTWFGPAQSGGAGRLFCFFLHFSVVSFLFYNKIKNVQELKKKGSQLVLNFKSVHKFFFKKILKMFSHLKMFMNSKDVPEL